MLRHQIEVHQGVGRGQSGQTLGGDAGNTTAASDLPGPSTTTGSSSVPADDLNAYLIYAQDILDNFAPEQSGPSGLFDSEAVAALPGSNHSSTTTWAGSMPAEASQIQPHSVHAASQHLLQRGADDAVFAAFPDAEASGSMAHQSNMDLLGVPQQTMFSSTGGDDVGLISSLDQTWQQPLQSVQTVSLLSYAAATSI